MTRITFRPALLMLALFLSFTALMVGMISSGGPTIVSAAGNGVFTDSGQSLGNQTSQGVALGDLDGQGGVDAFTANDGANRVWLNSGGGGFSGNGQSLSTLDSEDVALGDLDGLNGLDAVTANEDGANEVWLNDGAGQFNAGTSFEAAASRGIALSDLDGDSDLDAFVANNGANTVWLNDGTGTFTDSGQALGTANSYAVAVGDLDGDGDLDAIVANNGANRVWINNGGDDGGTEGEFTDSGQALGSTWSYDIALGDLDGDGDLDAYSASWFPNANETWINQGGSQAGIEGDFAAGGTMGTSSSLGVALGDVDDDIDLDALVANNFPEGAKVWLNDGSASFTDSGQALGTDTTSYDVKLADLDGDGDLDAFLANFGPNRVYFNGSTPLPAATFDVDRDTNDLGQEVTFHAGSGSATLPVMLDVPAPVTLDVHIDISGPSTWTEVMTFTQGQQVLFLQLVNPNPNPSVDYDLTLSVTLSGGTPTPADKTDELLLVFVDADQGMEECILCYVEWLTRLLGFDPAFGSMHHVDSSGRQGTPLWLYYTASFDYHSPELAMIVATHPSILFQSLHALESWTPVAGGLGDVGSTAVISQQMVDDANALIDSIEAEAGSSLQSFLAHEQAELDTNSLVGKNAEAGLDDLDSQREFSALFLTIILR